MPARQTRSSARGQVTEHSKAPAKSTSSKASPKKGQTEANISKRRVATKHGTAQTKNDEKSSSRKRKQTQAHLEEDEDSELPHNLGKINAGPVKTADAGSSPPRKKTLKSEGKVKTEAPLPDLKAAESLAAKIAGPLETENVSPSKAKKVKNNNYGLVAGQTPFPDWPHPTPEECKEVTRLLSTIHGEHKAPTTIPTPSLTVSGCGEVPSVLDALIRTRLSAATTGTNSSRAFQGIVNKFGILKDGIGKGSVDWDAVRKAPVKDIFEAIKSGGLADVKSKDIKAILEMVYEENQQRRDSLTADGTKIKSEDKSAEISKADQHVLSLDYLHNVPTEEAFTHLTRYPGIGPKTASCVLLFCLRRPSFAVDTHVFRLVSWLGWVPPAATRNTAYAHLDVKIPDDLKYPLHQLFIKHGKTCPRCRAATGISSDGWKKGCVIDHLVKRTGVKKGGVVNDDDGDGSPKKRKKAIKGKKGKKDDFEDGTESSGLSDLGEDDDDFVG
jgi:endonuclease III